MESSQENIHDESLREGNVTTDDNFENVEIDDDKISISSVETSTPGKETKWGGEKQKE